MRYISKNHDGTVAIWATIPKGCERRSDGKLFDLKGVRRRAGKTELFGGAADGEAVVLLFDGEDVDVSDLNQETAHADYRLFYPDFNLDIKPKLIQAQQDAIASYRIFDKAETIQDRTFRSAWIDGGSLDVDIVKAREVWKDKIREARKPMLEALDTEYMRADEAGDAAKKAEIAAKKQVLRDATKAAGITAAESVEDLKQVWPLEV